MDDHGHVDFVIVTIGNRVVRTVEGKEHVGGGVVE